MYLRQKNIVFIIKKKRKPYHSLTKLKTIKPKNQTKFASEIEIEQKECTKFID